MPTSSEAGAAIAISAQGLGKRYRLARPGGRPDTLRDLVAASLSPGRRKAAGRRASDAFWALSDASFEIRKGENVGILGLNGAGKSTLLKILSRVTTPTTGQAEVNGRVGALVEVGTGFHGELSGRENVYLYGAILGMTKAEIDGKFSAIVAFAGIGDFIDTPVKRYSSGMYVRLAFAVAAHLEPDVLLLDEVLSVGDLPFQRKCMEFAKGLRERDATILFVSHNMFAIKTMCERVIYLRQGKVVFDGPTEQGIRLYEEDCRLGAVAWAAAEAAAWPIAITDVEITSEAGSRKTVFDRGERMRIRFDYEINGSVEAPNFIVAFVRSDGVACCSYSTELDSVTVDTLTGRGSIALTTPPLSLVSELYTIEILAREPGFQRLLCARVGGAFHVRDALLDTHFGVFHEAGDWTRHDGTSFATPLARAGGAGR